MAKWYKVSVYRAHQGRGNYNSVTAFIFANDPCEVLDKYKQLSGVKRSINKGTPFPEITDRLTEKDLEYIDNFKKEVISGKQAKKTCIYAEYI